MITGIIIVIIGIVWISLASSSETVEEAVLISAEDAFSLTLNAILLALLVGFLSAVRPVQAKYIFRKIHYPADDFTIDSSIFTGTVLMIMWFYFYT